MYADICSCVHPSGLYVLKAVLFGIFFNKLVRTETGFAALAVHKRVVEVHDVSAGYPNVRGFISMAASRPDIVFAFLHKFASTMLFLRCFSISTPRGP